MSLERSTPPASAAHARWAEFDRRYGDQARSSDAVWATSLSPAKRIAIVEDLFATVRGVHEAAGDWVDIDARAWHETLEKRRRFVTAFANYREAGADAQRGSVVDTG